MFIFADDEVLVWEQERVPLKSPSDVARSSTSDIVEVIRNSIVKFNPSRIEEIGFAMTGAWSGNRNGFSECANAVALVGRVVQPAGIFAEGDDFSEDSGGFGESCPFTSKLSVSTISKRGINQHGQE